METSGTFLDKPINIMEIITSKVGSFMLVISCLSICGMIIPIVLDVFSRILLGGSLPGIIELEELLMVVLNFGILCYAQIKGGQITVDLFIRNIKGVKRTLLDLSNSTITTLLYIFISWRLYLAGMERFHGGDVTMDLQIPVWFFMLFAAFGTLMFSLSTLTEMLRHIRSALFTHKAYWGLLVVLAFVAIVALAPLWLKGSFLLSNRVVFGGIGFGVLLLFLFIGLPIGVGMALIGTIGMSSLMPNFTAAWSMVGTVPYSTTASFVLCVIPMFLIMGDLCSVTGVSRDLFRAANVWLGRFPGGLAVAGVTGCAGFSAVCGESMVTAATMGSVALPEMRRHNYDPALSCSALAAGGTLGILIPPSMGFIWYAIITEESVGKLFMAGLIPGLALAFLLSLVYIVWAILRPNLAPRGDRTTWQQKFSSLAGVAPMIFLVIVVLGGILTGTCSPTEGGAVGAFGTLVFALVTKRLSFANFKHALESTATICGRVILIMMSVAILGSFLAATRLPHGLADWVVSIEASRYVILAAICLIYIVLGALVNVIPMVLLTLPAIFPTVLALGFDPIWFGVLMVVLMELGQISPPVGINVFVMNTVAPDVPLERIYLFTIPAFLTMLSFVVILVLFPPLATWLPSIIFQ